MFRKFTDCALALLISLSASAGVAHGEGIYGFFGGPKYRGATREHMICTEMVGATAEQTAEMRAFCEAEGFKWTGRDNWPARAHRKQREHDLALRRQKAVMRDSI
jgi:hypothetical protein